MTQTSIINMNSLNSNAWLLGETSITIPLLPIKSTGMSLGHFQAGDLFPCIFQQFCYMCSIVNVRACQTNIKLFPFVLITDQMISIPNWMKIQNCSQIRQPNLAIDLCPGCPTCFSGRAAWAEIDCQIGLTDLVTILDFHSVGYRDHLACD